MTEQKTYIQSYCTIQNNQIILNGETIFVSASDLFSDFSKKAYQHFKLDYPKFFKMDNLSKLAFLAAEFVLKNEVDASKENNVALVFANSESSLDTDVNHQNSIIDPENYYPSPAVFVYTLPNICLGEISIKHQLKSENSFFIFAEFQPLFMEKYANILLEDKNADKVLCGWVDIYNEEYKAFLYLIGKEGTIAHNKQTLKTFYNN